MSAVDISSPLWRVQDFAAQTCGNNQIHSCYVHLFTYSLSNLGLIQFWIIIETEEFVSILGLDILFVRVCDIIGSGFLLSLLQEFGSSYDCSASDNPS